MKRTVTTAFIVIALGASVFFACAAKNRATGNVPEGFTALFDGKSLDGWRKLTEYSGDDGKWEVIDGVIAGDQYPKGKGGLLVTNKKYTDYEVIAEVKADYPIDSGLFFRVQGNVLSYQLTIDYRPDGEVGAVYCPGGGGFLKHQPEGVNIWKKGEYNTVRARIENQPPRIQAWINGEKVMDYQDKLVDGKNRVPGTGFFGIQVHPGDSWGKGNKVWFRRILLKKL